MAKTEQIKTEVKVAVVPKENYAKFTITNLARGFAQTLGNSMRRILLSSMPGVRFSTIEIDGALHEFTALEGVIEDVTQIILNLKQVVLGVDFDSLYKVDPKEKLEKQYVFEINHKGKGEIKIGDFSHSSEIMIVNPDQHIATISDGGRFSCRLYARRGIGYVGANENKVYCETQAGDFLPERIAIDSIFTPINRCRYDVKKGQNGEELILEVWTNGSIDPKDAVSLAANFISAHLSVLKLADSDDMNEIYTFRKEEARFDKRLNIALDTLMFSQRTTNCFQALELVTVGDLLKYTEDDLKKVRNLGLKSIEEIKEKLKEMRLELNSTK